MYRKTNDFTDCKNEQSFKMKYIKNRMGREDNQHYIFCIESEATIVGFPDVMEIQTDADGFENFAYFYEFKFSDKQGKIKLQPTQPSFYKRHPFMLIKIVAYNQKNKTVHIFNTQSVLDRNSRYYTENGTIDLCKTESKEVIDNESIDS